jgi:hypothetical protein
MSFSAFLTDFNLVVLGLVAAFGAGVVLSQKVKDYIKGVPSEARTALSNIEKNVLADVKQAQSDVIARLPGAAPAPKAPLPAASQPLAAPVAAPAPAPAPAPAADPSAPATA